MLGYVAVLFGCSTDSDLMRVSVTVTDRNCLETVSRAFNKSDAQHNQYAEVLEEQPIKHTAGTEQGLSCLI